jgi:hypothetical protein
MRSRIYEISCAVPDCGTRLEGVSSQARNAFLRAAQDCGWRRDVEGDWSCPRHFKDADPSPKPSAPTQSGLRLVFVYSPSLLSGAES